MGVKTVKEVTCDRCNERCDSEYVSCEVMNGETYCVPCFANMSMMEFVERVMERGHEMYWNTDQETHEIKHVWKEFRTRLARFRHPTHNPWC